MLFMVGSSLFALGAVPFYAEAVGLRATAITFFVGSIFFTSAGLLQYLEVANAPRRDAVAGAHERWRLVTWEPRRIEWWWVLLAIAVVALVVVLAVANA